MSKFSIQEPDTGKPGIHRHRGVLTGLTLAALLSVSALVLVRTLGALPDPATANAEGVFRWLVLRDLAAEPPEVPRTLVARLETLLQEPIDVSAAADLSQSQQRLLAVNSRLLRRVWREQAVDGYFACGGAGRVAYLDRQVDTVARWSAVDARLREQATEGGNNTAGGASWFDEMHVWMNEASGQRQREITEVVRQGLLRWMARYDLATEAFATRLALVDALLEEMSRDTDVSNQISELTSDEQQRFWLNVDLLARTAMIDRARTYDRTPQPDRMAFLGQQIQLVTQRKVVDQFLRATSTSGKIAKAAGLVETLARWTREAPEEDRPLMSRFSADLKKHQLLLHQRSLLQRLKGLLLGPAQ